MVTPQALTQLKAFARQDGAFLSVIWLASLLCMFKCPNTTWGPLLMLTTPFFIIWRLTAFRENILDGEISFRRALAYCCYVFFYASLLFALGQYLYFEFLDNGSFMQILDNSVELLKPVYIEQGFSGEELDLALKTIRLMKPIDLVFTFMTYNLFVGAIMSMLLAIVGKRIKRK